VRAARLALVVSALLALAAAGSASGRAGGFPPSAGAAGAGANLWRDELEPEGRGLAGERVVMPRAYRFLSLDLEGMRRRLATAPLEGGLDEPRLIVALPGPDGAFRTFAVAEAPVMEGGLASRHPDIRTFHGQGIEDPAATLRLDVTPQGFHAMVLGEGGAWYVDPWRRGDTLHYQSYFRRDHGRADGSDVMRCDASGPGLRAAAASRPAVPLPEESAANPSGPTLRTYRLAVAATGEYSAAVCSPSPAAKGCAMSAIVTTVNRVVGIYERELAVRLVLVADNDDVVYTNGATDPYSNNDGGAMLGQNQSNLDAVIGSANYDVGHVFSTGGGGVAYLEVPCWAGYKAQGVTGSSNPVGDAFDVDYVAHEMGHQFGAEHTFNGTTGSCGGGNRSASSAYEPGSGSTLMAYAGICGAENLQPHSDPHFHTRSFDQIRAYITDARPGYGDSCPVRTATGNGTPLVEAGPSFTIPRQTPFTLTGSASDPDGDPLTYCWEEYDLGAAGPPNTDVAAARPIFRSFLPATSPSRTFPRMNDVLAGTATLGESLPTRSRTMTFRLTARDHRAGGGGVDWDSTTVAVADTAGPFAVTTPGVGTSWVAGSCNAVTWDVASTDLSPVSCAEVDILMSADGGATFPAVLAAGTANDGAHPVNLPFTATSSGRVMVRCASNVFFAVSRPDFALTASPGSVQLGVVFAGNGSGSVSSSPGGIACSADCAAPFPQGACVELSAEADAGSTFAGWSGGGCSGTAPCTVTLAGATEVTATFTSSCADVVVSDETISASDTREACGTLLAGPNLTVADGGHAILRAAVRVVLRNGLAVQPGGRLTVALDPALALP